MTPVSTLYTFVGTGNIGTELQLSSRRWQRGEGAAGSATGTTLFLDWDPSATGTFGATVARVRGNGYI